MVTTLKDAGKLKEMQSKSKSLSSQPSKCFNHGDVRSDNIAYNKITGEVKFVDWNWASYTPPQFGTTEFLIDVARQGVDTTPWIDDLNPELLAALAGHCIKRILEDQPPLNKALHDLRADSAAIANYLYWQLKEVLG